MSASYISTKKESDPKEYSKDENAGVINNRIVYQYKIILLGDIAVGKTAILRRFIENEFTTEYYCTVGVEFRIKTIFIDNKIGADLKIWDTCGEEKYRTITRQYYRDSNGVLLVFDLTSLVSFEKLQEWYEDVKNNGPKDLKIVLAGNKKDLQEREVTNAMIQEFLNEHQDIEYIETSALKGEGISEAFRMLAEKLIKWSIDKENQNVGKEDQADPEYISNSIKLPDYKVRPTNTTNKKKQCC